MANDKQSLGLGFVRRFDLDVTIRELLAFGDFIGQCMDDARAEERQKCVSELIALTNQIYQEYQGHTWVDKASAQDNDNSSTSVQFALRRAIDAIRSDDQIRVTP